MAKVKYFIILFSFMGLVDNSLAQVVKAPDMKTIEMIGLNTTEAYLMENKYYEQNDSVRKNGIRILTATTVRTLKNNLDMKERQRNRGFKKQTKLYYKLVNQVNLLLSDAARLITTAAKNPHHLVFVTTKTGKLLLEVKNMVKYTVVVAYNGKVPNPFKVNLDDLKDGKDDTPNYEDDKEVETDAVTGERLNDGYNLLLPDDRMEIMRTTISHIRNVRKAMNQVYYKLLTDFNVRNLIYTANRMDGKLYDNNVYVIEELKGNIDKMFNW